MARRLWYGLTHPILDRDGRKLTAHVLVLTGITRAVTPPLVPLSFMIDQVYGWVAIVFGLAILLTSIERRYERWLGRLAALGGSGLLVMWAADLSYRSNVFWAFLALGFVLFREAIRR